MGKTLTPSSDPAYHKSYGSENIDPWGLVENIEKENNE